MRIDCHSHVFAEDHLQEQFVRDMEIFLGEADKAAIYNVVTSPEEHFEAVFSEGVERAIVFGLQAKASGIMVPNDYVAEYAVKHPDVLVGYASVDPTDPGARLEVERAFHELGLKGLKLGPIYQHVHPMDRRFYPLYQRCAELGMPLLFHQGSTTPQQAPLEISSPLLIEQVARAFPDLVIQIAHMGHPWYTETIQVLRKQPNVVTDTSSLWPRPWQFYNALILAQEYGVTRKLVYGTDFPFGSPSDAIGTMTGLNDMVEGTNLPRVSDETIEAILDRNAERLYARYWE